ncbi:hypothetical protein HON58_00220 [Candidatus Peregrinibacteria bacterium]|jgi:hypothetical protein|nr:hypothetical protein [Candidatus Peregrinibacteria bacterium]
MKTPHFTKVVSAFVVAVIFGVLALGVTSAFGEDAGFVVANPAGSNTPGVGVSPTFTGLTVTGDVTVGHDDTTTIPGYSFPTGSIDVFDDLDVGDDITLGGKLFGPVDYVTVSFANLNGQAGDGTTSTCQSGFAGQPGAGESNTCSLYCPQGYTVVACWADTALGMGVDKITGLSAAPFPHNNCLIRYFHRYAGPVQISGRALCQPYRL